MSFRKQSGYAETLGSESDEALCREVVAGNHEAFLVLFDRYWQDVFRLALSVLRNEAEAEDLVQALFLELHTTMLRFNEDKGRFRSRILRYAHTRAIDHRRRLESRRFYINVNIEDLEPENLSNDSLLASGLSFEENERFIEQGLETLDEKQRAVITAYFFRGLSIDEIATEQGESYGNVRHHLYRGLDRMRRALVPKQTEASVPKREGVLGLPTRVGKRMTPEVSGV